MSPIASRRIRSIYSKGVLCLGYLGKALTSAIGIRMDRHFWPAFPIFLHWQQVVCFSEACECPVKRLPYYRGVRSAGWRAGTLAVKLSPDPRRCRLLRSAARAAPPDCAPLHRLAQTSDPPLPEIYTLSLHYAQLLDGD